MTRFSTPDPRSMQFASVANVTYPHAYQRFLNWVDLVNFDLGWILSTGCFFEFDLNFHARLFISTIGPIIGMAILRATYAIALKINGETVAARDSIRQKHLSMALFLTFLVYSSVSATLFQMFDCEELGDDEVKKSFLRADYEIICSAPLHRVLQVYAGLMMLLYPLGIPLLYTAVLLRNRAVLTDGRRREDDVRIRSTSALWKPYKPSCFYYEVVECCRRILLTGIVVFIYPRTMGQVAVTIVITAFFTVVSEVLAPYSSKWDTWVSRTGHAIVFLSMYVALFLKVDLSDEPNRSQEAFGVVLVFIHACLVLTVVIEAVVLTCSLAAQDLQDTPRFCRTGDVSYVVRIEGDTVEEDVALGVGHKNRQWRISPVDTRE